MRTPRVVLLVSLLSVHPCLAQWCSREHVDLLQHRLDSTSTVGSRVDALLLFANAWMISARATPYLHEADSLIRIGLNDPLPEVRAKAVGSRIFCDYMMGYQAKFRRDMPQALIYFRRALEVDRTVDTVGYSVPRDQDAMGVTYRAMGLPRQAIACFQEELDYAEEHIGKGSSYHAMAHVHLAAAYIDLGDTKSALAQLAACDTADPVYHAAILMERARLADRPTDHSAALRLLENARDLVLRAPALWDRLAVLAPLARMRLLNGDADSALSTAGDCARIAGEVMDEAAWCGCRMMMGEAHLLQGNTHQAEVSFRNALDTAAAYGYVGLSREIGDEGSMIRAIEWLRDLYGTQGRYKEALAMARLRSDLKDSLDLKNGREEVLMFKLEGQRTTDSLAHAADLQRSRIEGELIRQRAESERSFVLGGALGLVLLLAGAAYFLIDRRRRKARYEQEQAVLRERLRIADDMHDDLGAGLSSLKLRSEIALEAVDDPLQQEQLQLVASTADALIMNMREILWAMGTDHTTLADLVRYVAVYARRALEERSITIDVQVSDHLPVLQVNAIQRRNIFLVVKEALHNVVKHAKARHVVLVVRWSRGLVVAVMDNGIGPQTRSASSGNGLRSMRKRADALGGEVTIHAGEKGGTVLTLRAPLSVELNKRSIVHRAEQQDLRSDD